MAEVCDDTYDWGILTKMLDERYNRYHVNAPNKFETLSFNEVIDFGEISGNVYHLSPMKYKEKILKKKFIPKSNNGLFKYPDRCYFFMDTMSKSQILSWVPSFRRTDKSRKNIPYCLYTIDVSKVNDNVTFYLGPNLKGRCYTADNLNPNVILTVEECK